MLSKEKVMQMRKPGKQLQGLHNWIDATGGGGVIAELGVWTGEATKIFGNNYDHVIAVDNWKCVFPDLPHFRGYTIADVKELFVERFPDKPDWLQLIQESTVEAAKLIPDNHLDHLYIDASHDYASIKADNAAWVDKVKPGGWIGGHDFDKSHPGVMKAVLEAYGGQQIRIFEDGSWLVRKVDA